MVYCCCKGPCPRGYMNLIQNSANCYRLERKSMLWQKAQLECERDGASLIQIYSAEENDKITAATSEFGIDSPAVWIDLQRSGKSD